MRYPIAPHGIFHTVQGEGALAGLPMAFVRLAGCSVGCRECDTDYSVARRLTADDVVREVVTSLKPATEWLWLTGGEPADYHLGPLLSAFRRLGGVNGVNVAIATSGHKPLDKTGAWLSVSPHDPARWVQRQGAELKLVAGLNGVYLKDFAAIIDGDPRPQFAHQYVQPVWGECGPSPAALAECLDWIARRPGWRMSSQAHKQWGLA